MALELELTQLGLVLLELKLELGLLLGELLLGELLLALEGGLGLALLLKEELLGRVLGSALGLDGAAGGLGGGPDLAGAV